MHLSLPSALYTMRQSEAVVQFLLLSCDYSVTRSERLLLPWSRWPRDRRYFGL